MPITITGVGSYRNIVAGWSGVTTGLTHHWPMDDANVSGTTISDIVGTDHGTASGAGVTSTTGPSGVSGTARAFDGSSNIALGSSALSNVAVGDLTICQWIYMPDKTATAGGAAPFFLNLGDGVNSIAIDYDLIDGFSVEVASNTGTFDARDTSDPMVNSTWMFVAAVRVGIGAPTLYIDGSSVSVGGAAQSPTSGNTIGSRADGNRKVPSGCRIGRTLIYDGTALSAGQISQNFTAK